MRGQPEGLLVVGARASVSNETRTGRKRPERGENHPRGNPIASRAGMETTRAGAHLYRRVTRVVFESALMVAGSGVRNVDARSRNGNPGGRKKRVQFDDGLTGKPGPKQRKTKRNRTCVSKHDQMKISKTPPRRSCPRGRPAPSSRFRPRQKVRPPASTPCARLAARGSSPRPKKNAGRAPPREPLLSAPSRGASASRASAGANRGAGRALSSPSRRFFLSANTPSTRPLPPLARGSG